MISDNELTLEEGKVIIAELTILEEIEKENIA